MPPPPSPSARQQSVGKMQGGYDIENNNSNNGKRKKEKEKKESDPDLQALFELSEQQQKGTICRPQYVAPRDRSFKRNTRRLKRRDIRVPWTSLRAIDAWLTNTVKNPLDTTQIPYDMVCTVYHELNNLLIKATLTLSKDYHTNSQCGCTTCQSSRARIINEANMLQMDVVLRNGVPPIPQNPEEHTPLINSSYWPSI